MLNSPKKKVQGIEKAQGARRKDKNPPPSLRATPASGGQNGARRKEKGRRIHPLPPPAGDTQRSVPHPILGKSPDFAPAGDKKISRNILTILVIIVLQGFIFFIIDIY